MPRDRSEEASVVADPWDIDEALERQRAPRSVSVVRSVPLTATDGTASGEGDEGRMLGKQV